MSSPLPPLKSELPRVNFGYAPTLLDSKPSPKLEPKENPSPDLSHPEGFIDLPPIRLRSGFAFQAPIAALTPPVLGSGRIANGRDDFFTFVGVIFGGLTVAGAGAIVYSDSESDGDQAAGGVLIGLGAVVIMGAIFVAATQ